MRGRAERIWWSATKGTCQHRHDCEGRRGSERYPLRRAKHGVRLFVSVAAHRKRVPEADSAALVNTASTGRVMTPPVHLDCAAIAIHVAGPHPVGKAVIRAVLLASLCRHIQDSVGAEEFFAAAPEARVSEIDNPVVILE